MRASPRHHRSNHSSTLPLLLIVLGSLSILAGFFLPWLTIQPAQMLERPLEYFLGALGRAAIARLQLHFSGWDLATGITPRQLTTIPLGGNGDALWDFLGAIGGHEARSFASQWLVPPIITLFLFPLLAIVILLTTFSSGRRMHGASIFGGVVLLLLGLHGLAYEIAMKHQEPAWVFTFVEVKVSVGAWLTLLGGLLWLGGGGLASRHSSHLSRLQSSQRYSSSLGSGLPSYRGRRLGGRRLPSQRKRRRLNARKGGGKCMALLGPLGMNACFVGCVISGGFFYFSL